MGVGVMKQLTQAIFNDCPNWVKSAAVDSDGYAYLYEESAELLTLHELEFSNSSWGTARKSLGGNYDTTNWQNSAIDRKGYRCPKCDYHHSPHQCRECECINCYSLII